MKPYTIGAPDFMGRSRVALRERNGRGETLGYVGQVSETGLWISWVLGGETLPGEHRTRAAAAAGLFEATAELIPLDEIEAAQLEGDEGSVAVCDLCGAADDHSHTIEEYGFPTREQLEDEEAQVLGEVNL